MPKVTKMPKLKKFYLFFPIAVNKASNSLHSLYSNLISSLDNHFVSTMTSSVVSQK
jgi:hypothetical protein